MSTLQEPAFGEADHIAPGDDEMVQDPDPDRLEGADESPGNQLIRRGDLRHSTRMLMREHQRGRIPLERLLHDLARIDGGAVDRAAEELHELDEAMPVVEKEATKGLEFPRAELDREEIAHRLGRGQGSAAPQAARQVLTRGSNDVLRRGGNRLAGGVQGEECVRVRHGRAP